MSEHAERRSIVFACGSPARLPTDASTSPRATAQVRPRLWHSLHRLTSVSFFYEPTEVTS